MNYYKSSLALLFAMTISSAFGTEQPSQECNVGPLSKTFGEARWLVYSCNNEKAEGAAMLVLVSAPGSPATPFVFFYYIKDGGYRLYGEGTGNKEATDAALRELQQLSEREITKLILQTRQVQSQQNKPDAKQSP
jgi:hypothetical protein